MLTGRRRPAGRAAWTRVAAIAGLAAVFQSCYFTAVSLTSVSLATLVTIGSAPVLVLAAERLRGRRACPIAGCATGLAPTGLGLLAGVPSGGFPETRMLASAGMAVLAAAGFATLTLIGARPVAGLDDLTAAGFGFTLGGLALLPLAAATGGVGFTPGPVSLALLAALGTGPTAVAYTLYFRGLRSAPAGTAALLSLLEPLTGTMLAALILGYWLGPAGIASPTSRRGAGPRRRGPPGCRPPAPGRRRPRRAQLINYYFGSKEGLYLALQRAWLEREESFAPPDHTTAA